MKRFTIFVTQTGSNREVALIEIDRKPKPIARALRLQDIWRGRRDRGLRSDPDRRQSSGSKAWCS